MLQKSKVKLIRSLQLKKHREEEGLFVVEGKKSVLELLNSDFTVETVVCTEPFQRENGPRLSGGAFETLVCGPSELESVSAFKTNDSALAMARMKPAGTMPPLRGLTLALDGVNDPGNLGTILRTADWYGIGTVLAAKGTTDVYNPKTLQASMGSFCRVAVHYVDLAVFLKAVGQPLYAASRGGASAHGFSFKKDCVLLLGNESHGVSPALKPLITQTVGIPAYGKAESLNVAAATAVLCDHYRRNFP